MNISINKLNWWLLIAACIFVIGQESLHAQTASGSNSAAFGLNTVASGNYSGVFGSSSTAAGQGSFVVGENNNSAGQDSFVAGANNSPTGTGGATFGANNVNNGTYGLFAGYDNSASVANIDFAFAAGAWNYVGAASTVFGTQNNASGFTSLATGGNTSATANYASSFGWFTTAAGWNSAAFGYWSNAANYNAAAFGAFTYVSGNTAAAFGTCTQAPAYSSFVIGSSNVGLNADGHTAPSANTWVPTDPLFEIGNGGNGYLQVGNPTYQNSDAFVVYKNGNAVVQGTLAAHTGLRCSPGGDLSMGSFTAGTQP